MAGTGTRLGWIVLSLLGAEGAASEDPIDVATTDLPSRELLLYLAEFDAGDDTAIDPLELDALPPAAAGEYRTTTTAVRSDTSGSATADKEYRDESN